MNNLKGKKHNDIIEDLQAASEWWGKWHEWVLIEGWKVTKAIVFEHVKLSWTVGNEGKKRKENFREFFERWKALMIQNIVN